MTIVPTSDNPNTTDYGHREILYIARWMSLAVVERISDQYLDELTAFALQRKAEAVVTALKENGFRIRILSTLVNRQAIVSQAFSLSEAHGQTTVAKNSVRGKVSRLALLIDSVRQIRKLKSNNYCCVLIYNLSPETLIPALYCVLSGVKLVVQIEEKLSGDPELHWVARFFSAIAESIVKPKAVLSVSRNALGRVKAGATVITPGVAAPDREAERRLRNMKFDRIDGPLRIFYAGRIDQVRGALQVPVIASCLRGRPINFHVVGYGQIAVINELRKQIKSLDINVSLSLNLSRAEYEVALARSHICLNLQADDGAEMAGCFPSKITEFMLAGKCVLSYPMRVLEGLPYDAIRIATTASTTAMVDAISLLDDDRSVIQEVGVAARQHAINEWSLEAFQKHVCELLTGKLA